jgi:hypothetical protein
MSSTLHSLQIRKRLIAAGQKSPALALRYARRIYRCDSQKSATWAILKGREASTPSFVGCESLQHLYEVYKQHFSA